MKQDFDSALLIEMFDGPSFEAAPTNQPKWFDLEKSLQDIDNDSSCRFSFEAKQARNKPSRTIF